MKILKVERLQGAFRWRPWYKSEPIHSMCSCTMFKYILKHGFAWLGLCVVFTIEWEIPKS